MENTIETENSSKTTTATIYVVFNDEDGKPRKRVISVWSSGGKSVAPSDIKLITTDKDEYEKYMNENRQKENWHEVNREYQNLLQSLSQLCRSARYLRQFNEVDKSNIYTRTMNEIKKIRKKYKINDNNKFNEFIKSQIEYIRDTINANSKYETQIVESEKNGKKVKRVVKKMIATKVDPEEYVIKDYEDDKIVYCKKTIIITSLENMKLDDDTAKGLSEATKAEESNEA